MSMVCVCIAIATKVTTFCTILMFIHEDISIEYKKKTMAISIKIRNLLIAMLNEELAF